MLHLIKMQTESFPIRLYTGGVLFADIDNGLAETLYSVSPYRDGYTIDVWQYVPSSGRANIRSIYQNKYTQFLHVEWWGGRLEYTSTSDIRVELDVLLKQIERIRKHQLGEAVRIPHYPSAPDYTPEDILTLDFETIYGIKIKLAPSWNRRTYPKIKDVFLEHENVARLPVRLFFRSEVKRFGINHSSIMVYYRQKRRWLSREDFYGLRTTDPLYHLTMGELK